MAERRQPDDLDRTVARLARKHPAFRKMVAEALARRESQETVPEITEVRAAKALGERGTKRDTKTMSVASAAPRTARPRREG